MPNPADLAALLSRVPADGSTIGNGALREILGWQEARYTAAKDALVAAGTLLKGQGRGGTVRRATTRQQTVLAEPVAHKPPTPAASTPKPRPPSATPPPPGPQPKPADQSLSAFIWSVADLLRGDYKQSDYGKVILPFTVLRRLDCVLEPTKAAVLAELDKRTKAGLNPEPFLLKVSGQFFYNTSPLDLKRLMGDQDHIGENLRAYIQAFSPSVRDIFASFEIHAQIDRLTKANLLYLVTEKFATIDLHPEVVSNAQMGAVFEELIRKFAELSNETAGEHFTPREVIRLMVNLLFIEDDDALNKPVVRTLYDPTAGTGGMLSVASEYLAEHNAKARLTMYGQELNPESYAICKADMLIKGQDIANICFGNTLSADGLPGKHFDYMLSNPPFGVEWRKIEKEIRTEADKLGYNGRFGPGLPRVSDGSLLFLLHLVSKMRPIADGGSRFGIVLNGSPLFTGGAGSGESEIRRYVLENDLVEAIISLPVDMFYNTGISTYVWIVSNRKPAARKGTVQLIDASGMWQKMRKSLGSKRKELSPAHIEDITRLFGDGVAVSRPGEDGRPVPISRVFRNTDFGYRTITVERPLRDAAGAIVLGTKGAGKGKPVADSDLRDTENVPLSEDVEVYFRREVLPHAPDAWIDHEKTKVGYEIPFNRHFYVFKPPRPLSEIDAELKGVTDRIRYLQSLHIKNNEVVFNTPYFVSPEWSSQHAKSILETGDVLIVQTGDIGQSAVVTDEFAGCNCHALIVVAPVRSVVDGEWIAWALNSEYGLHTLLSIQTGALHPHLNCGDVKDVALPLPSMQEQKNIVSYIKERSRIFDNLTSEAHRAITLLQERRTALISAAVTGQIDVRHLADTSAA